MDSPPELPQRISLIAETNRSLRENILKGRWQDHLPGERELCAEFQVSRPTLRSALKELERDGWLSNSQGKRRRNILGSARPDETKGKGRIVALSPRPLSAMAPSAVIMVHELRSNLARAGFQLDLNVSPGCYSTRPARALNELKAITNAAAWIVFGSREPMQTWLVKKGIPCLVAGSCAPGIELPSVDIDYRATCRHAGGILRSKGHRHISLVLPVGSTGGEADSEAGLREALDKETENPLSIILHDGTPEHLCTLVEKALRQKNPPTAFVVARALHALTVISHLLKRGHRIPQDIAVISRDNESFLEHLTPSPNRYATNPAQFTRRVTHAARKLAETGSIPTRSIRLMPDYIPGKTV